MVAGSLLFAPFPTFARTLDEIQAEISAQNQNLNAAQHNLNTAEANLRNLQSTLNSAQGELPRLQAEIAQIEAEVQYNNLQMTVLSESKKLKELEHEEREEQRDLAISKSYFDWRSSNDWDMTDMVYPGDELKKDLYSARLIEYEQGNIEKLATDIVEIGSDIEKYNSDTAALNQKNAQLKQRKAQVEAEIARLRSSVNQTSGAVAGLRSEVGVMRASLNQLTAEQRAIQEYDAWLLGQSGNGGTLPLQSGQIYFTGRGRDNAQGHGVGMSQYGARGAAMQGKTAEEILLFYYTGVQVSQYPMSSEISVKYCPNNPALDAYQDGCNGGETPVIERVAFNTYLAGLGEMPESWPAEARRAQVIAARTYAVKYTNNGNPNNPICLTTYCQVSYFKTGDQSEMSVVQSSANLVITYNGAPIDALYSADNNQGNGTGDHVTRFQNIDGTNPASYPYLRSVNDNAFAANSRMYWSSYCGSAACGLWSWRTNGYSYAQIDSMLNHVNVSWNPSTNNFTYATSVRNYVNGVRSAIGNVVAINFERDASQRVKRVLLTGNTGQTRAIGGYWFKSIWNSWVYDTRPTGQLDYLYSQTYFLFTN